MSNFFFLYGYLRKTFQPLYIGDLSISWKGEYKDSWPLVALSASALPWSWRHMICIHFPPHCINVNEIPSQCVDSGLSTAASFA